MATELTDGEVVQVLASQVFGHLGCALDNTPYVVPMAYAYKDNVLYGQTVEGMKVEMLRRNPQVCFQVERKNESGQWESVICRGEFEELAVEKLDTAVVISAAKLLNEKLASVQEKLGVNVSFDFHDTPPKPVTVNGKAASLFRIVIQERSGRRM